jgi:hypothetical protein
LKREIVSHSDAMDIVVREVREVRPKSRSGTRRFRRVLVARARARVNV